MTTLREQWIIMARDTYTPIDFWRKMTFRKLFRYIEAHNNVFRGEK